MAHIVPTLITYGLAWRKKGKKTVEGEAQIVLKAADGHADSLPSHNL